MTEVCIHKNNKEYFLSTTEKENILTRQLSVTHPTKPNPRALGKTVWDENEKVYWKRESDYEFLTPDQLDNIEKLAFLEASMETNLVIQKKNKSTSDAQIVINWVGSKDEPYFRSNNPAIPVSGVLAYAYGPGQGIGGDVTMNADQPWWLGDPLTLKEAFDKGLIKDYDRQKPDRILKTYDPVHTFKHEAGGHALGIPHVTDTNHRLTEIMYPYYNGLRAFGPTEKAMLHDFYGDAKVNPIIKEELLGRILKSI